MIIRAKRPESGFTLVDNHLIRDKRMSLRARGLLMLILSYPDDWRTDSTQLARETTEGREAIRTALRELESCGYLVRTRQQGDKGRWITVTTVYDRPQDVTAGHTEDGFPGVGSPDVGSLGAIRSTDTNDCDEDGLECVDGSPWSPSAEDDAAADTEFKDWRAADLALFRSLMDCDHVRYDKKRYTVEAVYKGIRTICRRGKPISYPGRYCTDMTEREQLDEFLNHYYPGMERVS